MIFIVKFDQRNTVKFSGFPFIFTFEIPLSDSDVPLMKELPDIPNENGAAFIPFVKPFLNPVFPVILRPAAFAADCMIGKKFTQDCAVFFLTRLQNSCE